MGYQSWGPYSIWTIDFQFVGMLSKVQHQFFNFLLQTCTVLSIFPLLRELLHYWKPIFILFEEVTLYLSRIHAICKTLDAKQ